MSLLAIILVVFLVLLLIGGLPIGPWSQRVGGYGYGYGHGGIGIIGILVIIALVLLVTGRL
jgi:hypothetical protein